MASDQANLRAGLAGINSNTTSEDLFDAVLAISSGITPASCMSILADLPTTDATVCSC